MSSLHPTDFLLRKVSQFLFHHVFFFGILIDWKDQKVPLVFTNIGPESDMLQEFSFLISVNDLVQTFSFTNLESVYSNI